MIKNNLRGNSGYYIMKFITGQEMSLDGYSSEHIVFPYSENLKIISYRSRKTPKIRESDFLIMPENVFARLASDMEGSGFYPSTVELEGEEGEYLGASSAMTLISYDVIFKFLKNGFSFRTCVFRKDRTYFGVDRFSRIWSNDREIISTMGELTAQYLSEALKNFPLNRSAESTTENMIQRPYISDYSANSEVFERLKLRLGKRRITLSRRFRNGENLIYAFASNQTHRIEIAFTGTNLSLVSMNSTDLNTLIVMSEIVEKAGGIFVGTRSTIK